MAREVTQEQADRHNDLTKKGWNIVRNNIYIHDKELSEKATGSLERDFEFACQCFLQALTINPDGWSSMWALGKIHQRLGQHDESLDWFGKALKLNPGQPDVAREAGLAALDAGKISSGLQYCQFAVENDPTDAGLVCNLALAYMMAGDDQSAIQFATEAVQRAPDDEISQTVLEFIDDVKKGIAERPKKLEDAFPN